VVPLKAITILNQSFAELNFFAAKLFCCLDSTTVLSRIRNDSTQFNVFVSNRASRLQKHSINGVEVRPNEVESCRHSVEKSLTFGAAAVELVIPWARYSFGAQSSRPYLLIKGTTDRATQKS